MRKVIISITIFVFVVAVSGWLGVLVDSALVSQSQANSLGQGDSPGMGIWLILPLLTALILIFATRLKWRDIGLSLNFKGNMKWYLIATLIFPVVTAVLLIFGKTFKWINFSNFNFQILVGVFMGTLLVNFIKNIFEESAWRGFLTSQLLKFKLSDWKLYLAVGTIWGIWHIPYYLVFLTEESISLVMPVGRIVFAVYCIVAMMSWAVMFIELFRITKSIWPGVILHAVEDSLINPLATLRLISIAQGKEFLISPVAGIVTTALYLIVGLGLRSFRKRMSYLIQP